MTESAISNALPNGVQRLNHAVLGPHRRAYALCMHRWLLDYIIFLHSFWAETMNLLKHCSKIIYEALCSFTLPDFAVLPSRCPVICHFFCAPMKLLFGFCRRERRLQCKPNCISAIFLLASAPAVSALVFRPSAVSIQHYLSH